MTTQVEVTQVQVDAALSAEFQLDAGGDAPAAAGFACLGEILADAGLSPREQDNAIFVALKAARLTAEQAKDAEIAALHHSNTLLEDQFADALDEIAERDALLRRLAAEPTVGAPDHWQMSAPAMRQYIRVCIDTIIAKQGDSK